MDHQSIGNINDTQLLADGCTALLQLVFGENNWYRWNAIKQQTQLDSLQSFIAWMLDVAEQEINKPTEYVSTDAAFEADETGCDPYVMDDGTDTGEAYAVVKEEGAGEDIQYVGSTGDPGPRAHASRVTGAGVARASAPGLSADAATIEIIHDGKTFYCSACGVSLSDIEVVKEHLSLRHTANHAVAISCRCCQQVFSQLADYVDYHKAQRMLTNVGSRGSKLVCEHCARQFSQRVLLQDHIANKHDKTGPRHRCPAPHCGKRFSHYYDMCKHRKKCAAAPTASQPAPLPGHQR